MFITFEGIDKSGKTTQAKLLAEDLELRGYRVILTREPGGTEVAEKVAALLKDPSNRELQPIAELFLYMASRSQHTLSLIIPSLKEGKTVISDRYSDSTLAYQGYGRGLDRGLIGELNRIATSGLTPELTILIDIPPEVSAERMRLSGVPPDRLEEEGLGFLSRVREGYLHIAESEPGRFIVIDGMGDVSEIRSEIGSEVLKRLMER